MPSAIVAVIPIRGSDAEFAETSIPLLGGHPLVEYTLLAARESTLLDRIIVSTDSEAIAASCRQFGIEVPFIRPPHLSAPGSTVTDVLLHAVRWLEEAEGVAPEWVVKLEITHPFRPPQIVDMLIQTAIARQLDSAILVREESGSFWTVDERGTPRLAGQDGEVPRGRRRPFYRDASGLASITRADNLKQHRMYGSNLGLIPFRNPFGVVDTHDGTASPFEAGTGAQLAAFLAPAYLASRGIRTERT